MRTPVKQEWDYTHQAAYYSLRPNYAPRAIDALLTHVKAKKDDSYVVADVGAGTGNLTLMLLERGLRCIAIEPNEAMRDVGMNRTKNMNVEWIVGTGEATTLPNASVNLFVMGSSFNTTDRTLTLKEAHRVLRPGGYFTCMWNHRDIDTDPAQRRVEEIIRSFVPAYERGVRREDQTACILASKLFDTVHYIEGKQTVSRLLKDYIEGWKSVKNTFWDLGTREGAALFDQIAETIKKEFSAQEALQMTYVTRIWTAKRV